jgi:hypothetical protein
MKIGQKVWYPIDAWDVLGDDFGVAEKSKNTSATYLAREIDLWPIVKAFNQIRCCKKMALSYSTRANLLR